jgi:hypothetical protein
MMVSKSVVDAMAEFAQFGGIVARLWRLWRSFSNCASPGHKGDAVLGTAVRVLPAHWRQGLPCGQGEAALSGEHRMCPASPNLAASIRSRLLNVAKTQGEISISWADGRVRT